MNLKAIMIATCSATAMAIAPNVAEAATVGSPAVANVSGHSLAAVPSAPPSTTDSLYVGDAGDDSIQRFDVATGKDLGTFASPPSDGVTGPRGILHEGNFLVSYQNPGSESGEINKYHQGDGKPLGALVSHTDDNAPFAPDGIIRAPDNRALYVADQVGRDNPKLGRVAKYDVNTGRFLGNLDFGSFITNPGINPDSEFHPRGLVFGPDGLLYVSVFQPTAGTLGWILSYNTRTGTVRVVVAGNPRATDCSKNLHRPDGLTFGPNGKLYVTSFRADANDIDRILIFDAAGGVCADEIDLDQVGQPRAFAQYILFGPGGYLFAPIAGGGDAGAVRRYDVNTKVFTNLVAPGGSLGSAWGLTFGKTNPTTLSYPSS